jgi:hypothetical protein
MERSTKRRRLRAPSPAMVVACIALAIALSGASYAAVTLPKNSVGTKQLKKNAVTSVKVQDGTISGGDVANGSLKGDDIDESSLQGVDAATLGGHSASDFSMASSEANPQFDAYVAGGADWIDANSAGRSLVTLTRFSAPPAPSTTQVCTQPGAASAAQTIGASQSVHLVNGSKITGIVVDFADDALSLAGNGTVSLTRMPIYSSNGDMQDILTATLANQATGGSTFTATDGLIPFNHPEYAIVDNTKYVYTLLAKPALGTDTTLTLAANAGATSVRVNNTGNLVVGGKVTVDPAGANPELMTIASIANPAPPSPGTNLTFTAPLGFAHANGATVSPENLAGVAFCSVKLDYQLPNG